MNSPTPVLNAPPDTSVQACPTRHSTIQPKTSTQRYYEPRSSPRIIIMYIICYLNLLYPTSFSWNATLFNANQLSGCLRLLIEDKPLICTDRVHQSFSIGWSGCLFSWD